MAGIVAFGAHVPRYRLDRGRILKAVGWAQPATAARARGQKAVANHDEDAITAAVAAARNAGAFGPGAGVGSLYLASTSAPYAERQNSAIAAEALGLGDAMRSADVTGSARAGTTALLAALADVTSGRAGRALVCAGEVRRARPGSVEEHLLGDGGAAVCVGAEGALAELVGSHSVSCDFPDRVRGSDRPLGRSWEERWVRDEGLLGLLPGAVSAYLERCGLEPGVFSKVVLPVASLRDAARVARALGLSVEVLVDPLAHRVGHTGAAHPLLLLCRALEEAEPGEEILLVGFGSGVDVLHFRATDAVRSFRPRRTVGELLKMGKDLGSYEKYAAFRDLLAVETGMRGEFEPETPMSVVWRHRRTILGLVGSRCRRCGTPQFPPQRVCANGACRAVDEMEPHPFADRPCRVFSYTADLLAWSPNPPLIYGVVDFEGGGRMMVEFTDCDLEDLAVGLPVDLVFRRKYHDRQRGIHTYFWKCVPAAS